MPSGYRFLLHYFYITRDEEALEAVTTTLYQMAEGGIYDQVGGGFSRYSTDRYWKVPHFEKMLYDNAQLVSLYSAAFQATKDTKYQEIVYETLGFVDRELSSETGGFFSSLDADSEGEEGKFYVWKLDELHQILGEDADLISGFYSVTEAGNWEKGNNILFRNAHADQLSDKFGLQGEELKKVVSNAKKALLEVRNQRARPQLDDKILTSWNALMVTAYTNAYRVFDDDNFLQKALNTADFIRNKLLKPDYRLDRNYKGGTSSINGFLDDYAFTIEAFIQLYQATFDEKWLHEAMQLTMYTITHFYDSETGMFFYTSDLDPALIARKIEVSDNVIPSANSAMAKNLFVLGCYYYNDDFKDKAKKMVNNVKQDALKGGPYYSNWDVLIAWCVNDPYMIVIAGEKHLEKRKEFDSYYFPDVFLAGGTQPGNLPVLKDKFTSVQTSVIVCQNKTCNMPVYEVIEAIGQMKKSES